MTTLAFALAVLPAAILPLTTLSPGHTWKCQLCSQFGHSHQAVHSSRVGILCQLK